MFQAAVGATLVALGIAMVLGAMGFRADASYSGIGPAFYPNLVAGLIITCGALLVREAVTGGYRKLQPSQPANPGAWRGFALISASLLLGALLITRIGFTLTCALQFAVVAYAFGSRRTVRDVALGLAISLVLFWIFARGLGLSLPALLPSGWI